MSGYKILGGDGRADRGTLVRSETAAVEPGLACKTGVEFRGVAFGAAIAGDALSQRAITAPTKSIFAHRSNMGGV